MFEIIFKIIVCHMLGDYVLQSDFIAQTKGSNWYHLFAHCILYIVPFYLFFGLDFYLLLIFASHFAIDAAKARYKSITYINDQTLHYIVALICFAA